MLIIKKTIIIIIKDFTPILPFRSKWNHSICLTKTWLNNLFKAAAGLIFSW